MATTVRLHGKRTRATVEEQETTKGRGLGFRLRGVSGAAGVLTQRPSERFPLLELPPQLSPRKSRGNCMLRIAAFSARSADAYLFHPLG